MAFHLVDEPVNFVRLCQSGSDLSIRTFGTEIRMPNNVTKAELVSRIAEATGLRRADAEKALAATTAAIQGALQDGRKVTLVGFGTFSIADRKARTGRDPQTKKPIRIPASKAIRFKPGKAMKEAVNP